MSAMNHTWTADSIRELGVRTDLQTACSVIGISKSSGYQLVNEDRFPVKVIRVGGRFVVPVQGLLDLFDI